MVDYQDPVVIAQDYSTVLKLWHVVAGLYFWEFVTTLDYEWSVIQRHRPYRWPIWIYSTTRIAAVISLVFLIYGVDDSTLHDCQTVLQLSFGYLSIASSSLLIVLRIFAIWNKNKIILAIAAGLLGINIIFLVQGIVRLRVVRDPLTAVCLVVNRHIPELNVFCTLATDIILLLIMFFGLLRLGFHERSAFDLGRLLWKQGLIWLLVATIAEALPAVFISLNLNNPLNYIFWPPSMVTLSIAATRIHRDLVDHESGRRDDLLSDPTSLQGDDHVGWKHRKTNCVPPTHTLPHIEIDINRTYEQEQR